ncbi:cyclin-dependent kinase 9-like [Melanaphis sacchari]|uniref:cyclin-dependent kinase 9-like n=1 Tax=Melanaphis sacchari TaxID=742174 RepID=UPI000DC12F29|nr:cyclin-dependent kinase 9-like [Melanaphis sacchari]
MENNKEKLPAAQEFSNEFIKFMTSAKNSYSPEPLPSPSLELKVTHNLKLEKEKYLEQFEKLNGFEFSNDVNKYQPLVQIGKGSYGDVFKAQDTKNPDVIVAIKKINTIHKTEGFPMTSLREVRILKQLSHENVIKLIEVCHTKACNENKYRSTFFLIFEFCEHDLAGLIANTEFKIDIADIKQFMKQLFNGLFYLHLNKILHRDLKSSNILVTKKGILKLADFGLSRAFSTPLENKPNNYTNGVVTLWYRPPELLLGERNYGTAIDMWGAGCIMAEFWTRFPILQGSSDMQQLILISSLCGSITPEVWPKVVKYEVYNSIKLPKQNKRKIETYFMHYLPNKLGCDLIDHLLTLDPDKRFDANTALNHDFFWKDPMPSDLSKAMSQIKNHCHEFSMLRRQTNNNNQQIAKLEKPNAINNGASTSSFPDRIF